MQLSDFDASDFMKHYWQQRPVVLKQVLPGFVDFLDEHDLAGLSQDDEVDSRIVQYTNNQWQVTQGPFDDFAPLCQGQWTLLVQGVDRYLEEAADLMRAFSFIPYWRMDDLMVSFANKGGGVGPHRDQYDVFLVQGKGNRHWKVGEPGAYRSVLPHPMLAQLEPFEPIIDVILNPGDILYIPPGWPHDGVALNDCLTYSVGFRAPDQAQLVDMLPDIFEEASSKNLRYTDPHRAPSMQPGAVTSQEIAALKGLIRNALDSSACDIALMRLLSDQQLPEAIPQELLTSEDIKSHLQNGGDIVLSAGCRPLYQEDGATFTFYVNGEQFSCDETWKSMMIDNINGKVINVTTIRHFETDNLCTIFELLATLINKGYWAMQ